MTPKDKPYWVGSMNGQLVIYDHEMQLAGSHWVILYFQTHEKYVPYLKTFARSIIKSISEHNENYDSTVSHYKAWQPHTKQ